MSNLKSVDMRLTTSFLILKILSLLVLSCFTAVSAIQETPSIDVYQPVSSDPIIEVYWNYTVPEGCTQESVETLFQSLVRMQNLLKKSIYRFISEYPGKFDGLALLSFRNVSDPEKAEVIYEIYLLEEGRTGGAVTIYGGSPWKLNLDCKLAKMDQALMFHVVMHELIHTLGVGHIREGKSDFEVMGGSVEAYYPTTLDLYAIYVAMFKEVKHEQTINLPPEIEYKSVIPYDVELGHLREENERLEIEVSRLQSDLNKLQEKLDQANDLITVITQENQQLKDQVSSLRESLENLTRENAGLEQQLAHAQNEVSKLQDEVSSLRALNSKLQTENQHLKRQLQQANQTILTLSILTVCLIAITIAVITFRRRG